MGIFFIIKITPLSGMVIISFIVPRACQDAYKSVDLGFPISIESQFCRPLTILSKKEWAWHVLLAYPNVYAPNQSNEQGNNGKECYIGIGIGCQVCVCVSRIVREGPSKKFIAIVIGVCEICTSISYFIGVASKCPMNIYLIFGVALACLLSVLVTR